MRADIWFAFADALIVVKYFTCAADLRSADAISCDNVIDVTVIVAKVVQGPATAILNTPIGLNSASVNRNILTSVGQLFWVWKTDASSC